MRLREKTTSLLIVVLISTLAFATIPLGMSKKDYATIQDGTIVDVTGNPITVGYDQWGYNYQAHMFRGYYENYARPEALVTDSDTMLIMKWSDSWLSNKDRNFDTRLDRGNDEPYTSSAATGAWLTNHQWGVNDDGTHWYYFVKIVYPGDDAVHNATDDTWYTAEGVEIGPAIWGAYARILQISNDPALDEHGVLNNWPAPTGFGYYK